MTKKLNLQNWCEFMDLHLQIGVKTDGAGLYGCSFVDLFDGIKITEETKATELLDEMSNKLYIHQWIATANGKLNMQSTYSGLRNTYESIILGYKDLPEFNQSILSPAIDIVNFHYFERQDHILNAPVRNRSKKAAKKEGFVYLIQSKYGHKIGRSRNIKNRSKQFEVKLPFDWEFVAYGFFQDCVSKEKDLHIFFDDYRINGEWFDLSSSQVEYIKKDLLGNNIKND